MSISIATKEKILKRLDDSDRLTGDDVEKAMTWTKIENTPFDFYHGRPLPKPLAQKAIDYINVLVKDYPYQVRYAMARPLWDRFTQAWCETGDESASLRAI